MVTSRQLATGFLTLASVCALGCGRAAPALEPVGVSGPRVPCDDISPMPGAGSTLDTLLRVCPWREPLFLTAWYLTVQDAAGQPVEAVNLTCSECATCASGVHCDPFLGVLEIAPGEVKTFLIRLDGRRRTRRDICPSTGTTCSVWEPMVAGSYTAQFCVSRSGDVRTGTLGPKECVAVPFDFPFTAGTIGARFL